jgi:alkylhydroperoxidase family enzyme
MGENGCRLRIEPTREREQIGLLHGRSEQRVCELTCPLALFGGPASGHPEAYRRVLRTLGDGVETLRPTLDGGRKEVPYRSPLSATADEKIAAVCHIRLAPGVFMFRTTYQGGDMTGTTRIPEAEITGIKGALVKRMATKMMGRVPTPLGVYWHNPKVLKTSFAIGNKVQKWDACDENLKSLAHMAVASLVGCTWCLDFNYFQAHNENLDLKKAREVPRWHESDVFTSLERDVMAYAEAMSQTPPTVTDELSARLLGRLGAAALVELTAVVSFANFTTRGNVALGIESDGFAEACDLKPLAVPTARSGVASAS